MKSIRLIFLATIILASCKPDALINTPAKTDYYALKVGKYQIYNVISIQYYNSSQKQPDTFRYQVKDSFQSSYKDQSGQTAYRIVEYKRNNALQAWQFLRDFSQTSNSLIGTETDGNITYVKLIFPPQLNAAWNPNKYNTTDSAHLYNAQYVDVNAPYTLGTLKFDSTVKVQLHNDSNLVELHNYNERYAANIGLVAIVHDSIFKTIVPNQQTTIMGYRYSQTLIDYGPR